MPLFDVKLTATVQLSLIVEAKDEAEARKWTETSGLGNQLQNSTDVKVSYMRILGVDRLPD